MNERWRIRLGMLALVLVVSCGGNAQNNDAGMDGGPSVGGRTGRGGAPGRGGTTGSGATGGSAPGGQSGGFGPGTGGNPAGSGGVVGTGTAGSTGRGGGGGLGGTAGRGGSGGAGGTAGVGGTSGSGGAGGVGGTSGVGGTPIAGRGGFGGMSDLAGRGGGGASGGVSGSGGSAGTGGLGGTGGAGTGGTAGTGGVPARGGSGGTAGTGGTGGTVCLTCRTSLLEIDGQDVVYSAARNELYVSIAGGAASYPNTIAVIDPATAAVRSAIPIGSEPGPLALSDDGSTLWVGIAGAHALRKVTMSATPPVVGPLVHLPKVRPDAYFDVASLAVLPGQPLSVVAVMSDGSYTNEVRVFDDGVPRSVAVSNLPGSSFYRPYVIAGPRGTAFGLDGFTRNFYVYTISASGVTAAPSSANLVRYDWRDSLAYVGDRVFAGGGGDAIDVSNLAAPSWVGRVSYGGQVARRDATSLIALTIVSQPFPSVERTDIRIYSSTTLAEIATVPVPEVVGALYPRVVYAGGDAAAFIRRYGSIAGAPGLVIVHDPALGTPIGGGGGAVGTGGAGAIGGTGGAGGTGGLGGTGGAPDACAGCTITTVQAYGHDMVLDPTRNLIYVAADSTASLHPSTIVTVDPATSSVASFIPVGNDPQALALSDDGSVLWAALAGERRVRRLTPGATPAPGPVYSLPTLLTTGEASVPASIAVLPGAPTSIAVGVYGNKGYGRGVFILDDGQPRANFVQPPEVTANFLQNGPPGYLLGFGDLNNLITLRLRTAGATLESYGGLLPNYYAATGFLYSAGAIYTSTGEVIDLSNPDDPVPAGRFAAGGGNCKLASRSATRVMMLCPGYGPGGILMMLDNTTFTRVGSVTTPSIPYGEVFVDFIYLGGDAIAMLGTTTPLQILHAPLIGSPP